MSHLLADKISDSELEVMKVLWKAGDALPVNVIRETLQKDRGWEPTTVKTLIGRLTAKGAVRQEKRNVFYYSPLISEEEYNAWATDNLIRKLYNGSARDLVAALVQSDGLSREDVEELRKMFRVEE
ncbi:MAG: BlaI/MecI/CopY family transcriptional regulator [Oscillospiraceae bacterium]|nr:BlaI/MecI/CopY family transcriptional regulator [Oscillospiraceae bacterium]